MKTLMGLLLVLCITGCNSCEDFWLNGMVTGPDQCLRATLFEKCMDSRPRGVDADWDGAVKTCNMVSHSQSLRALSEIKQECRR